MLSSALPPKLASRQWLCPAIRALFNFGLCPEINRLMTAVHCHRREANSGGKAVRDVARDF